MLHDKAVLIFMAPPVVCHDAALSPCLSLLPPLLSLSSFWTRRPLTGARSGGTKNVKVPQVLLGWAAMAHLHAHAWGRQRASCSTESVEHKSWFFPRSLGDSSYGRGFLPHLGAEHEKPTWYGVEVKTRILHLLRGC